MDGVDNRTRRAGARVLALGAGGALLAAALGLAFGRGAGDELPADPHAVARRASLPTGDTSRLSARELLTTPVAAVDAAEAPRPLDRLVAAIRTVESMDGRRRVGDRGRSLGDYHIGRRYWAEGVGLGGVDWDYDVRVWSPKHCRQVILWYWQRWCPEALAAVAAGRPREGDLEKLARTHNGGPTGAAKSGTWRYWQRVREAMTRQRRQEARADAG